MVSKEMLQGRTNDISIALKYIRIQYMHMSGVCIGKSGLKEQFFMGTTIIFGIEFTYY